MDFAGIRDHPVLPRSFIQLTSNESNLALNLILMSISPLSLYFHIPFCTHRCAYCDFNTYAGQEEMIPAYVDALIREIQFVGKKLRSIERANHPTDVHTIFFGGGTPSLLTPGQFASVFEAIRDNFTLTSDAEITIEANPGTVSSPHLHQ